MKKLLLGLAAGATIAYLAYKVSDEERREKLLHDLDKFRRRSKRNINNAIDMARNQAEYLTEEAGDYVEQGKKKVKDIIG